MDHAETLHYLDRIAASGIKLGLGSIRRLLAGLGSPQEKVPMLHIAGSNGKGSVAAFLTSVLSAGGYQVGTYTSPHLTRVEERVALNGRPIAPDEFAAAATRVRARVERMIEAGELEREPTYFEFLTALAFHVFEREECELAVVEAGMGGRLDATNTVERPMACIITRIDLEHADQLGATLEEIAREKAGIVRAGVPTLTMERQPGTLAALREAVRAAGSTLIEVGGELRAETDESGEITIQVGRSRFRRLAVPLPGEHQVENLALALRTVELLASRGYPVEPDRVAQGVAETRWPGRLEIVRTRPTLLLDGAHNPAGARALAAYLDSRGGGGDLHLVFGAMRDKDIAGIMAPILPRARRVYLTRASLARAASLDMLEEHARKLHSDVRSFEEPGAALDRALTEAGPSDMVLVAGSLILIGEIKSHLATR